MMKKIKARLREIKDDKHFFKAASNREQDISDFQSVVCELEKLFVEGFVEDYITHSHTGHEWVDFVCVGKLTAKGEAFLEDYLAEGEPYHLFDHKQTNQ